ncbi:S-adenosyl-L-methionine-dependent methyltransferase [Earliella scabrosa]|nr:S-adenosyl-L-methionine-dependent methyltransferase [Earliella scabrosa]
MVLGRLPRGCSCLHRSFRHTRLYSSTSTLPPLPPPEEWRQLFPYASLQRRDRVFLKDPDMASTVARALLRSSPDSDKGKVVIEAFPGPGALSRALLELPSSSIHKLIVLEDDPLYLKYLEPLQDADPRVTVVPMSGHSWDTYAHLQEQGLLEDVQAVPWEEDALPNLHFVSHLQHSVKGEQLIAQLFRSIPERAWLFQYGRVPMSILLSDHVWKRLTAPPSDKARCKLSVIGDATADIREALDSDILEPYESHFHPPPSGGKTSTSSRRTGQAMHAVTSIPYAEQVIAKGQIDQWDYCLRRLFVMKNTPVKNALNMLAPGASTLVDALTSASLPREQRVNVSKKIRELNVSDWALILRAFDNWPFKPVDLMIGDAFLSDID